MCKDCGDRNWLKREEYASLEGYTAFVTGGRIKIGYEAALKLLRSGAFVVVTTRFPVDAVKRYSEEEDFDEWYHRLRVYQIDFRQLQSMFVLIDDLYKKLEYLDILINNAAQTVRHDYSYYETLSRNEEIEYDFLSERLKLLIVRPDNNRRFAELQNSLDSLIPIAPIQLRNGHNVAELEEFENREILLKKDKREQKNSWISKACDVSLIELLEVQIVNSTVPFMLCTNLRQLMERSPHKYKHIINVSAMEGKFSKKNKNCFHPHTNMAKASLNMFTRTSAQEFKDSGILMNSVDTGWITDENPEWLRERNEKKGFIPPLDAKDGASRLCDPIFSSVIYNRNIHGAFLKDYEQTGW
jgi:NAD(P)-dependent dehydrogenase (short-subunit alcohol dehydrogenase family)